MARGQEGDPGNKDTLHLPPEACPYVVVLTGVPILEPDREENYAALQNKVAGTKDYPLTLIPRLSW